MFGSADHDVVPRVAVNRVHAADSHHEVIAVAAEDRIVAGGCRESLSRITEVVAEDLIGAVASTQHVVPTESQDEVVTAETHDHVDAGSADELVGPVRPDNGGR